MNCFAPQNSPLFLLAQASGRSSIFIHQVTVSHQMKSGWTAITKQHLILIRRWFRRFVFRWIRSAGLIAVVNDRQLTPSAQTRGRRGLILITNYSFVLSCRTGLHFCLDTKTKQKSQGWKSFWNKNYRSGKVSGKTRRRSSSSDNAAYFNSSLFPFLVL
jgi:hypothetical protein